MRGAKAQVVKLSKAEREGLEKLIGRHQVGRQIAKRARIVLAAARGQKDKEIAEEYRTTFRYGRSMAKWLGKVAKYFLRGLEH